MMNRKARVTVFLALAMMLYGIVPVYAQDVPPCAGDSVSGTVIAVDEETGVVTLDAGDVLGPCTVTLDGEYDHPIVDLLGSYFGDANADDLAAALKNTQGCAVPDGGTWTWADCNDEDAQQATVVAENEDGTFTILIDGEEVQISIEDPETVERLREALGNLDVDWELGDDGSVVLPGDEIAAYHEDGLGFGVLVKLYAMAATSQEACDDEASTEPCGVTVEELVAAAQAGAGLGDLFKEYVRPSITGIGHVRDKDHDKPDHAGPKDRDNLPEDDDIDDDDDGEEEEGPGSRDRDIPPGHAKPKKNDPPDHAGPKKPKPKKKN